MVKFSYGTQRASDTDPLGIKSGALVKKAQGIASYYGVLILIDGSSIYMQITSVSEVDLDQVTERWQWVQMYNYIETRYLREI